MSLDQIRNFHFVDMSIISSDAMRNHPITLRRLIAYYSHLSYPSPTLPPNLIMAPLQTTSTASVKILMLHGFTQSGPLFHSKTRALAKHLTKLFPSLSLTYPTGPHRLQAPDMPYNQTSHDSTTALSQEEVYGWWRRKDGPEGEVIYEGIEEGLETIAKCIREEGPFDGVVGFSQGAAAAGMVASLLEGARRLEAFTSKEGYGGIQFPASFLDREKEGGMVQAPLKFCIVYSGFMAPGDRYKAFYEPKIGTKSVHFIGQVDTVVSEERSRTLVGCFVGDGDGGTGRVVVHPGGHFTPSQRPWLDAVAGFLKNCLEGGKEKKRDEENVEEMDVPF